jgi:hypothetical protein
MSYQKRYFAKLVLISGVLSVFFIEAYPGKLNRIEFGFVCLGSYIFCYLIRHIFFIKPKEIMTRNKD